VTDQQGQQRVFATAEYRETPPEGTIHRMDCIDCHNRPAHVVKAPNFLVEQAMSLGRVDRSLPIFKEKAVAALSAEYATVEEAMTGIDAALREAYPDRTTVQGAIEEVQRIYRNNFFPLMNARWDKYPDNIGHKNWLGCFRCHDDEHSTPDGTLTISASNCSACHTILSQGTGPSLLETSPGGQEFQHPGGDVSGLACTFCHNGGNL